MKQERLYYTPAVRLRPDLSPPRVRVLTDQERTLACDRHGTDREVRAQTCTRPKADYPEWSGGYGPNFTHEEIHIGVAHVDHNDGHGDAVVGARVGNKAPLASPREGGGRVSNVAGGGGVVLVQEGGEDIAATLASDRDYVVRHCTQRRSERPPVVVCGLVVADRARL